MKPLIILSLFDGISCGQLAVRRILPKHRRYVYYACEINQETIKITQHNFPNTIQLGDVRNLTIDMIPHHIDIIIGGSPCQNFSFAGRKKGLTVDEQIEITSLDLYLELKKLGFQFKGESYLFWEFVRVLKEFKSKYFLLENVVMNKKWQDIITNTLEVEPIKINSSRVSAQNRERLYWTNIPNITVPDDMNIHLSDILPGAKGYGGRGNWDKKLGKCTSVRYTIRKDGKANCLLTNNSGTNKAIFPNGVITDMTPDVWEQLQTLPVGYTDVPGVSKRDRYKGIGNGWTVKVIEHIFQNIPELY